MNVFTFGEAMIRIAPDMDANVPPTTYSDKIANTLSAPTLSTYDSSQGVLSTHLSVGGDELNVSVALSRLGVNVRWGSLLPTGPIGDIVRRCGSNAGVNVVDLQDMDNKNEVVGDVGVYFVLHEEKKVHYQRGHSIWGLSPKEEHATNDIFEKEANIHLRDNVSKNDGTDAGKIDTKNAIKAGWLHVTGITPMTAEHQGLRWQSYIKVASKLGYTISMDFNHRPQLGSLEKLWNYTKPILSHLDVMILSLASLKGICELEGMKDVGDDYTAALEWLQHQYSSLCICMCVKHRHLGIQNRYSVWASNNGVISTEDMPVVHVPKDDLGGGSAWAAGIIHYCVNSYGDADPATKNNVLSNDTNEIKLMLRHADLLAALCQETKGDLSVVTSPIINTVEKSFSSENVADFRFHKPPISTLFSPNNYTSINTDIGDKESSTKMLHETLNHLKQSKIIAILRATNKQRAIERSKELILELGCRALEITMDSTDIVEILEELAKVVKPEQCLLGVGTVCSAEQLDLVSHLPIRFAISPINPPHFTQKCHDRGILAIPAAFTPQELWTTKEQGALAVKLFPASLWKPSTLKSVLGVGKFSEMNIIPTGGVDANSAPYWLESGAMAVAMGSNLSGRDIKYQSGDPKFKEMEKEWIEKGRNEAEKLFKL